MRLEASLGGRDRYAAGRQRFVVKRSAAGRALTGTSALSDHPLGHQGGRYDADSGLYHFNAGGNGRDYSPMLGRWGQKDGHSGGPYVDGMNAYEYVGSNPQNRRDPSRPVTRRSASAAR